MKYGHKIISYLLACAMLISCTAVPTLSYAEKVNIEIPVTITEKNGISISDRLERRGIAIEKGRVYNGDELVMTDERGRPVPFFGEPMQYYDDGSIKWMKCSFLADLKPNEIKKLYIRDGMNSSNGTVSCIEGSDKIELENGKISLRLGYRGIESIKAGSNELLPESGLNVYACTAGTEHRMKGTEFEVVQSSGLYAKAKVSGMISDTLSGEICVTLSHNSELIDIEYRINAIKDEVIVSTGMTFDYKSCSTGIVEDDYLSCGRLNIISPDNSKFRGAVSKRKDTGFVFDGNTMKIAPIVNNAEFTWYDGVTRTNHLYISLSEAPEMDYKTVCNPPDVTVSAKQFEAAGMIAGTEIPAPAKKFITALHWASDKLDGRFEAGSIPYDIDVDSNLCSSFGTRNGEMEFYLGYGYMMCGDPLLYKMITDSAESWADVVIYKGGKDEIYGANRYRTGEQYGSDRFFTSHPYYGDLSGLYMAYMISGNEYLEEVFKISVEYMYRNMYVRTNSGEYYPRRAIWSGERVSYTTEAESRYLIQARGLYLAYQLYGDEKYREAAMNIVSWAKKTQTDKGFWYQAYHDDGRAYVQSKQMMPAVKNYIYLYGIRGILEMFEYEQSDEMKEVITKCADFLCYENKTFGPGLWHPFGNVNEYEVNEDNTRGKSPMSDIMAVDVLYCAYKITGNELYFSNLLSLLDVWLCAQTPGGSAAHKIGANGYSLQIANTVGQNLTLLRHCSEIEELIDKKYDTVIDLGYTGVAAAFGRNSHKYDADIVIDKYSYPEITLNAYESDNGTAIMGMNITGSSSGDLEKDLSVTVKDSGLWQGMRNKISTPYAVTLQKKTNQFDCIRASKCPVYVTGLVNEFEADIIEYNSEKIVITMYDAEAAEIRIKSGKFAINGGEGYTVHETRSPSGRNITVTKGGDMTANENNELEFSIGVNEKNSVTDLWFNQKGIAPLSSVPNGKELNVATQKLWGINVFPDTYTPITNEEAYGAALSRLAEDYSSDLESLGVEGMKITVPAIPKNDEEAVKIAARELELAYDGELLSSDVELVQTYLYDTKVSWTSSNEAVLSNEGVLTRGNIVDSDATVTMTAHIRKNSAATEKDFVIPLNPKEEMNWRTKVSFNDCKYSIIPQKDEFEMTFTVVPDKENINALVGLSEGALGVSAMSQLAVIVRFNSDGYIDAYNKTAYTAENSVPYSGRKEYSFRMLVRPKTQDFDAYVSNEDGEEIIIAKNYGFRLSAPSPGVIDTVYLPAAIEDNCFSMFKNSLAEYRKQPKPEASESKYGLSYGRFVTGKIYLPPVSDNKKQSWVTEKRGLINSFNILSGAEKSGTTMLYRVESESDDIGSVTDIAKIIGMAGENCEEEENITTAGAAQLLRVLGYFYK